MFELTVKDNIASAHLLRGYPGKCSELHGHTWKVEITVQSDKLNEIGLVTDFAELKMKFKEFLKTLDHKNLNELEPFKERNPSAENIAKHIYEAFGSELKPLQLSKVQVWESDVASAVYYE